MFKATTAVRIISRSMGSLIYSTIGSLDGYIADEDGKFDWAEPDEEVHAFVNELARPVGTFLLGRRMYEVLAYWDDPPALDEQPFVVQEFTEIWRAADKVVFSRTLETTRTARTRVAHDFDVEEVRRLKAQSDHDLAVAGPELAAQAIKAGLVDEYQFFVVPVVVGAGKRALPDTGRIDLELVDERRFRNGTVFLRYRK
jgi:dihydrofolate reductase